MDPVLAMPRGLDVQLWVELMEIKGQSGSFSGLGLGFMLVQMRSVWRFEVLSR